MCRNHASSSGQRPSLRFHAISTLGDIVVIGGLCCIASDSQLGALASCRERKQCVAASAAGGGGYGGTVRTE